MKIGNTEARSKQSEGVPLFAIVGRGSPWNAQYSFELGGWSVTDQSTHLLFRTLLPANFEENDVYSSIDNLENLLAAMFVNDHLPRRIFYFDHPRDLPKQTSLELMAILGQCGDPLGREGDIAIKSFDQAGWIFNFKPEESMDVLPFSAIKEWFELLSQNDSVAVAASIGLIQESFAVLNEFSSNHRYHDYLALSKAIILMMSGLESLFFYKSNDKADIAFKFRLIGALFYERFVSEDFLQRFDANAKKLTFLDMKTLLGCLYDIRSMVAHGKAQSVLKGKNLKKWNKVFDLLHVGPVESSKRSAFLKHIVLSLGCLQRHILALIVCSKEELIKGAEIVNEARVPQ